MRRSVAGSEKHGSRSIPRLGSVQSVREPSTRPRASGNGLHSVGPHHRARPAGRVRHTSALRGVWPTSVEQGRRPLRKERGVS